MQRVNYSGDSLTIPCEGSLIVPSNNIDVLPSANEFNLDPRRLTTAESPFGGVNGLVSYSPGSVHVTVGDGIYLTDVAGNNSSKDLPAGLLSRLGYLTVDTVAHTITDEFIVANTATSNNPTVIDACDSINGWSFAFGSGTVSVNSGIVASGTANATGYLIVTKNISWDLNSSAFICFSITASANCNLYLGLLDTTSALLWSASSRFSISAGTTTRFILPIHSIFGSIGTMPTSKSGMAYPNLSQLIKIQIGVGQLTNSQAATITISSITADVAKPAYIETSVPDNITSVAYQKWTGSAYETNCIANMDSVYSTTFLDSAKMVLNNGTKFDDVYGSGNGRSRFTKGVAGQTVNGSLSGTTMTYSANKGIRNRIGFRVDLPPSDGGRTAFNQCRIKKIINYTTNSAGKRATTYELSNDNNASTGLLNISKPWLAIIDPTTKIVNYYIFTERPVSLSYKSDESGNVYEVVVNPGNGLVFHGQTVWANNTLDTNSDSKPDMLDATIQKSIANMLSVHGFNK